MSLYKILFETPENKWKTGIGGMVCITILLAVVFNYEAGAIPVISEEELARRTAEFGMGANVDLQEVTFSDVDGGYAQEGTPYEVTFNVDKSTLLEVRCSVTWTDEPSTYTAGTNEPDTFTVTIIAPNGDERDSDPSNSGSVSTSFQLPDYENDPDFEDTYNGEWTIEILADPCGDDSAFFPLAGRRVTEDTGNDFTLNYSYSYMDNPPEENPEQSES